MATSSDSNRDSSTDSSRVTQQTRAAEHDQFEQPHEAGAQPTAEEERAADAASRAVDVEKVGEHADEMYEKGANLKGEGRIS